MLVIWAIAEFIQFLRKRPFPQRMKTGALWGVLATVMMTYGSIPSEKATWLFLAIDFALTGLVAAAIYGIRVVIANYWSRFFGMKSSIVQRRPAIPIMSQTWREVPEKPLEVRPIDVVAGTVTEPSEDCWATALSEFEGPARRQGIWARAYAEASGNEANAKAIYLQQRANELQVEHEAKIAMEQAVLLKAEKIRLAEKAQRDERSAAEDYAALKGKCPNNSCGAFIPLISEVCPKCSAILKGKCPNNACGAIIPLISQACPKCNAIFDEGNTWTVTSITTT